MASPLTPYLLDEAAPAGYQVPSSTYQGAGASSGYEAAGGSTDPKDLISRYFGMTATKSQDIQVLDCTQLL